MEPSVGYTQTAHTPRTGPRRDRHASGLALVPTHRRHWAQGRQNLSTYLAPHGTVLPSAEAAAVRRPETLRTYSAEMHVAG